MGRSSTPRRLYKYRAFNANTLRLLNQAEMYHANPAYFNDPLDCRPIITVDTDLKILERLCYRMLVLDRGKDAALACMQNHRYMSTQHGDYKRDPDATLCYTGDLKREVRDLVYSEMRERGVLSLAMRWNCPLMWSHYADEHRGLCIEYHTKNHHCEALLPVNYNTPGAITVSDLYRWKVEKSADAGRAIREAFFYAKAREWRYEREWRDVGAKVGARESTFKSISAVYFGMKCDPAVSTAVVMLFSSAKTPIKFFKLYREDSSFKLKRSEIDTSEVEACGLRTPVSWELEKLDEAVSQDGGSP
jgi:Protein of unknown function (DUF2971)